MAKAPRPSHAPVAQPPGWAGQLAGVLAEPEAPQPEPADQTAAAEHQSLAHHANHWINDVGIAAARQIDAALSRSGKGYSLSWTQDGTTPDGPTLTLVTRLNGVRVFAYELHVRASDQRAWPIRTVTRQGDHPREVPFPKPRPDVDGLHLIGAEDVAADFVAQLVGGSQ